MGHSPSNIYKLQHKNTIIEETKSSNDRTFTKDMRLKASKHQSLSNRNRHMNKIMEGSFIGQINTTLITNDK
jgi:hypothetical protein